MRIAVTGTHGQVASALAERGASLGVDVARVGRPALDLLKPASVLPALRAAAPDLIVSAAAYTAVDRAETEAAIAHAVNGDGAGAVARAASQLGVPLVHLSTDYVFDGSKLGRWREDDAPRPLGVYGASKLAGERLVAASAVDHAILRVAWIYSPFGANFVRTMLRLAESRDSVRVVADQLGGPTSALDIADGVLALARNLLDGTDPGLRGIFHMAPAGEASWADLAEAVFTGLEARGGRRVAVERIATADYPTPAARPANSRLDSTLLAERHAIRLPDWRASLNGTLDRLVGPVGAPDGTRCESTS